MYVVNVRTDTREYIVVHAGHLDLFLTRSKKLGRKTSWRAKIYLRQRLKYRWVHHINNTGDKYKTLLGKPEKAISETSEYKIKIDV